MHLLQDSVEIHAVGFWHILLSDSAGSWYSSRSASSNCLLFLGLSSADAFCGVLDSHLGDFSDVFVLRTLQVSLLQLADS